MDEKSDDNVFEDDISESQYDDVLREIIKMVIEGNKILIPDQQKLRVVEESFNYLKKILDDSGADYSMSIEKGALSHHKLVIEISTDMFYVTPKEMQNFRKMLESINSMSFDAQLDEKFTICFDIFDVFTVTNEDEDW